MNSRLMSLAFAAVLGLASVASVSAKDGAPVRLGPLTPDTPVTASIPMFGRNRRAASTTFRVSEETFAVEVSVTEATADLDLVVYDEQDDVVAVVEELAFNESVFLSRAGDPILATGVYTVEVVYQYAHPPTAAGATVREIPFTVTARFITVAEPETLDPGLADESVLAPDQGMMRLYRVDVPAGAQALRIDVTETDGDLDIFAHRGEAPADPFRYAHSSQTVRSTESLVVTPDSVPPLVPGPYSVMILDQVSDDAPVDYSLLFSLQTDPPESLVGVRALPAVTRPIDRALLATVEVSTPDGGGSGCLVATCGYILTNWHVVEAPDGYASDDIMIGISVDHSRPPAELFVAELVDAAEDRDLALLRITAGRYGTPLPAGHRFPALELRPTPVSIADELRFVGYPWIGGTGSRASITYTSGTVSGYQKTEFGLLLKSDGEINPGNSGGAALDARYRLVGLPTSVVGENAGQLAYVVPVDAIPDEWLVLIRSCDLE